MSESRIVHATHGLRTVEPDPEAELTLTAELRRIHAPHELLQLAARHALAEGDVAEQMRRAVWRALARSFGNGVRVGRGAIGSHFETFEIADGVFIGEQAFIQGRAGGRCVIGAHAWIGPQSYF